MSNSETTTRQLPKSKIFQFAPKWLQITKGVPLRLTKQNGRLNNVTSTFRKVKNTAIVPFDGKFFYFPLSGSSFKDSETSPIIKVLGDSHGSVFGKLPGTDMFVCIGDPLSIYFVTAEDIDRGVIRKSRKINLKRGLITYDDFKTGAHIRAADRRLYEKLTCTEPAEDEEISSEDTENQGGESESGGSAGEVTFNLPGKTKRNRQSLDVRGSGEGFDLAELQAIDLAMQDQERALFGFEGA